MEIRVVEDGCSQSKTSPESEKNEKISYSQSKTSPESEKNTKISKVIPVRNKKKDFFYDTNHKKTGIAIIFDHENFDTRPKVELDKRLGTHWDSVALREVLEKLGFEVTGYKDNTTKEVTDVMNELEKKDFSDYDCMLIAVMSHGIQGIIYTKDDQYPVNMLIDRFTADKCPSLAGKPKIYIIQSCQGKKYDPGVELQTTLQVDSGVSSVAYDAYDRNFRIPIYADFLIAYSTVPGYYSWRHKYNGSWFIQTLCQKLNNHWQEFDFLTILILVNGQVAFDFESDDSNDPLLHRQKQIPYLITMFTRILKFSPKKVEPGLVGDFKNDDNNNNNGSS